MDDKTARRASHKTARRLIPFLILCFLVAYLDRVNVGFGALTMNKELGLTAEMFGFGAGIFFFGYFIFEVPRSLGGRSQDLFWTPSAVQRTVAIDPARGRIQPARSLTLTQINISSNVNAYTMAALAESRSPAVGSAWLV
jgi:hypothetical protein